MQTWQPEHTHTHKHGPVIVIEMHTYTPFLFVSGIVFQMRVPVFSLKFLIFDVQLGSGPSGGGWAELVCVCVCD